MKLEKHINIQATGTNLDSMNIDDYSILINKWRERAHIRMKIISKVSIIGFPSLLERHLQSVRLLGNFHVILIP